MSENKKSQDQEFNTLQQLIGGDLLRELQGHGLRATVALEPNGLSAAELRTALDEVIARSHESQAKAQKLAALGTMGAGVVHEVRNVLTAVAGFAHVAQRPSNEERRVELLATIEAETMRAVEMLGHFLAFARNRPKIEKLFSINEVLKRSRRATLHQLQVHQVKLNVVLAEAAPNVRGAPGEIEQVLVNLILNAQQASDGGSSVEVSTTDDGAGMLRISVSDQGSGIETADLEQIFDPFFTTKASGTGLGLAVSKRIAEEHGGDLSVESLAGQGTTFVLSLPIAVLAEGETL